MVCYSFCFPTAVAWEAALAFAQMMEGAQALRDDETLDGDRPRVGICLEGGSYWVPVVVVQY
jgi:hypothetical protein